MDHRKEKRHRCMYLVKIRWNEQDASGLVYNSSRQGLFVLSKAAVQNNQYVDILTKDVTNRDIVRIPGFIVHHDKNGFGLIFCEPDSTAREFVYKISNQRGLGGASVN